MNNFSYPQPGRPAPTTQKSTLHRLQADEGDPGHQVLGRHQATSTRLCGPR